MQEMTKLRWYPTAQCPLDNRVEEAGVDGAEDVRDDGEQPAKTLEGQGPRQGHAGSRG